MKLQHKLLVAVVVVGLVLSGLFASACKGGSNEQRSWRVIKGYVRQSTNVGIIEIEGQRFLVVDNADGVAVTKF